MAAKKSRRKPPRSYATGQPNGSTWGIVPVTRSGKVRADRPQVRGMSRHQANAAAADHSARKSDRRKYVVRKDTTIARALPPGGLKEAKRQERAER
jgi:hypothetical protein